MKIVTKRLWLRPINEKDNENLRIWRNTHKEMFFSYDGTDISPERQDKWFKKYTSLPPGTDLMFIATILNTGEEVGTIALYDVKMEDRTAVMGRVLVLEKYRGHDYAQEMVDGLRDFAFETMRLHVLVVETDILNKKAKQIYFKAGFDTIGQRFIPMTKYLFRIVEIMELLNPDHDTSKPLRIVETD